MVNKLERLNQSAVSDLLAKLETKLNADVFTYYGEIVNGVEREVKDIIENLAKDDKKTSGIVCFPHNSRRKSYTCSKNGGYTSSFL